MSNASLLGAHEDYAVTLFRSAKARSGHNTTKARKLLRDDLRAIHGAYSRALDLALEEFARERAATRGGTKEPQP